MLGLRDTMRGNNSRRHIAPPVEVQEEQRRSRESRLTKEELWQSEEDPVGYFGKHDLDKMKV